jgi:hypothetical protein
MVPARGKRPENKGVNVGIDLKTKKIVGRYIPSTFNGLQSFSTIYRTKIILDHTSTPMPSTHIVGFRMLENGREDFIGPTLTDLFEETNEWSLTSDETLGILTGSCKGGGFCLDTQGLSLIDMTRLQLVDLVKPDKIGSVPNFSTVSH